MRCGGPQPSQKSGVATFLTCSKGGTPYCVPLLIALFSPIFSGKRKDGAPGGVAGEKQKVCKNPGASYGGAPSRRALRTWNWCVACGGSKPPPYGCGGKRQAGGYGIRPYGCGAKSDKRADEGIGPYGEEIGAARRETARASPTVGIPGLPVGATLAAARGPSGAGPYRVRRKTRQTGGKTGKRGNGQSRFRVCLFKVPGNR